MPPEASSLLRRDNWKALPVLAALLLYADASQACLTVAPGAVPTLASAAWIDTVHLDRSSDVVHASVRSSTRPAPVPAGPPATAALEPSEEEPMAAELDKPVGVASPPQVLPAPAADPPASVPDAVPALMKPVHSRIILQGEFAVMFVEALRLRAPHRGWSAELATSVLATLRLRSGEAAGVFPAGGWQPRHPLTEAALVSLLEHLGLQVYSRDPERRVTVAEAEAILARIAALFRPLAPAAFTASEGPAGLNPGNPRRAPASPFQP